LAPLLLRAFDTSPVVYAQPATQAARAAVDALSVLFADMQVRAMLNVRC
jgi:hypothetical protein